MRHPWERVHDNRRSGFKAGRNLKCAITSEDIEMSHKLNAPNNPVIANEQAERWRSAWEAAES